MERVKEHVKKVQSIARKYSRELSFGMRINLIVADTEKQAWDTANEMISRVDQESIERLSGYFKNADSKTLQRIQSFREQQFTDPLMRSEINTS